MMHERDVRTAGANNAYGGPAIHARLLTQRPDGVHRRA